MMATVADNYITDSGVSRRLEPLARQRQARTNAAAVALHSSPRLLPDGWTGLGIASQAQQSSCPPGHTPACSNVTASRRVSCRVTALRAAAGVNPWRVGKYPLAPLAPRRARAHL